jgi:hypothetical protein
MGLVASNELLTKEETSFPRSFREVAPQARHHIEDKHKTLEGEMWCLKIGTFDFVKGPSLQARSNSIVLCPPRSCDMR